MRQPEQRLLIRTHGDSPDDLFELLEWFNGDDELRGRVGLQPSQVLPGQMGDLYDVLVVAVGAGGIAPALARSLTAWFAVRRSDIAVTLEIDDRTKLTLDAKRVKTPEIAQALRDMLEQPRDRR